MTFDLFQREGYFQVVQGILEYNCEKGKKKPTVFQFVCMCMHPAGSLDEDVAQQKFSSHSL